MFVYDRDPGSAYRETFFINRKPASNLWHAPRIAEVIGMPFTVFATMNFTMTSCPIDEVSVRFAEMRNTKFNQWARRPGKRSGFAPFTPTHGWVIEAGGDVTAVHWLLHIPDDRRADFETRLPIWMTDIVGPFEGDSVIDIRDATNPRGAVKYMLKGIDPQYSEFYGIEHVDQGVVYHRRSGYSNNVGPSAKKRLRAEGRYRKAWKGTPFPAAAHPRAASAVSIPA